MRYSLNGKPPYKASLEDIRAYAVGVLGKGEDAEVHADDKVIGAMMVLKDDHDVKKDVPEAYAVFESYERKDRDGENIQQMLRSDGSVIGNVIMVDPADESKFMLTTGPSNTGEPAREYTYSTLQRALVSGHEMIMEWPYREEDSLYMGVLTYPERICTGYILRPEKSTVVYGHDTSWKVLRKNGTLGKIYSPNPALYGPRLDDWESILDGTFNEKYLKRLEALTRKDRTAVEMAEKGKVMDEAEVAATPGEMIRAEEVVAKISKSAKKAAKALMERGYTADERNRAKSVLSAMVSLYLNKEVPVPEDAPETSLMYDWDCIVDDLAMIADTLREMDADIELDEKGRLTVTKAVRLAKAMLLMGRVPAGFKVVETVEVDDLPTEAELRKAADKLVKKLSKRYKPEEIRAALSIMVRQISENIAMLRAGERPKYSHDWTLAEDDLVEIIEKLRRGGFPSDFGPTAHDISLDIAELQASITTGLKELDEEERAKEVDRMKELTDKALELEKPNGKEVLKEALKDELAEQEKMQARRPVCWMNDRDMSDALYGLNVLAHTFFKVRELHDDVCDEAYLKEMGIPEKDWPDLREAVGRAKDIIGRAYDERTAWLINGGHAE